MEKLIEELIESVKKDKKSLIALKKLSADCKNFELAAKLRDLEQKLFPESKEVKSVKAKTLELRNLFGLVDLDIPQRTCYVITETIKIYSKKGNKFSIKDAAIIKAKEHQIFD